MWYGEIEVFEHIPYVPTLKAVNDTNVFFSHAYSRTTLISLIFNCFSSFQECFFTWIFLGVSFPIVFQVCRFFRKEEANTET